MPSRTGLDLDTGEHLHYRGDLRSGDEIAVTDRRLLVRRSDEFVSVPYTNVSEVAHESFNWFLTLMSLSLAVFGFYSISENAFVGVGLAAFGLWSVYRTYRHRDRVRIHTHSQAKPVEVFPEDVDALYDELEPAIEAVRAEQETQREGEESRRNRDQERPNEEQSREEIHEPG
ncbi:hypothetical protein [Natrialba swarupiae]|uniref:hypothetical protein n=1 Tax=Natrialba swarupiae TaxID=2448032 RepID=UPI001EE4868A|nr:hypothetical protein [Natrialba swarupiae]